MSCEVCGLTTNLKSCGRCLQVNYCSREHQIAHWKEHRSWCKGHSVVAAAATSVTSSTGAPISNGQVAATVVDECTVSSTARPQGSSSSVTQAPVEAAAAVLRPGNHSDSHLLNGAVAGPALAVGTSNGFASFPPENTQLRSDLPLVGVVPPTGSQNDSQICPSMASLRVCDSNSASSGQLPPPPQQQLFASSLNSSSPAAEAFSSHNVMPPEMSPNRDAVFNNLLTYCQIILKDMNQYGFCVIDNFLQNGEAILAEVKSLYGRGLFRAGQVVNNRPNSNTKMIRGDQIIWVEGNEPICGNIGFLIRILDSIIAKCNTTMSSGEFLKYTINRRTKAMIACYPGNNTKYVRHIDNPNSDGRCITSIYYLNKDYDPMNDGGVLRLFPQMNDGIVANIEPKFNRVIFFWSDRRNPHEVMPSARMRFAITVWYFDANERAKAIQKYKENSLQCPTDKDLAPFGSF